jgi:general L-amino acid transport system permease protein
MEQHPRHPAHVSPPVDSFVRKEMVKAEPPPLKEGGVIGWVRKNLFSNITNSLLTLFAIGLCWIVIPPLIEFSLVNAVWTGEDRGACTTVDQGGQQPSGWFGACWPFVGDYFNLFIYGRYPADQYWRVNIVFALFALGTIPMLIASAPFKRTNAIFLFGVFPVIAFILLTGGHVPLAGFLVASELGLSPSLTFVIDYILATAAVCAIAALASIASGSTPVPAIRSILGIAAVLLLVLLAIGFDFGLRHVPTENWGGLLVTLVIAVTGIVASLPLGILLALGRRSKMPVVRLASVIFIEFVRGVPLISVLFMSSVMLPLFLPDGVTFDKLLRALIGVALFSSAYMAEVVRGGIQALPKGQYEGAMALGLNYWQMMRMIILPQALKLVIPGIVNSFIALFKDTTLVLIIGLFDFLGMIQSSYTDPTWASPVQSMTGYFFAAIVFWMFCFAMSRYSIYMERKLDTGHR